MSKWKKIQTQFDKEPGLSQFKIHFIVWDEVEHGQVAVIINDCEN